MNRYLVALQLPTNPQVNDFKTFRFAFILSVSVRSAVIHLK